MAKSRYEWLKQEQAKEQKAEDRSLREMRRTLAVLGNNAAPISQYLGNTGFGEDGKLQPQNPTNMVQTQSGPMMVHEGEDMHLRQDGSVQVIPANQSLGQSQLAMIEKRTGMPGMASGGIFNPIVSSGNPVLTRSSDRRANAFANATTPSSPQTLPIPDTSGPDYGAWTRTQRNRRADVNFPVLNPPTATIDTSNMFQVASQPATPATTTGGGTNPPYNAATDDILFTTPDSQLSPEQIAQRNWLASQGIQYVDPNQFTNIAQTPASDTSTGDTSTGDTPQTDPNQTRWDRALARLENIAAGQDPRAAQIRAQEMQRLSAEEQAQRGALEQQMSQVGVTGTEAATERAMLGTQLGAQQQNLAGQLRQQEYANMMSAASALPGQIQGRATFDLGRNQSAINAMIASGDFEGAAALFQRTFGVPLDTTRLTTEQSRADFAAGMENLTSYIASGLTFDEAFVAMQADGTVDMLDLDENDLHSLYNTLSLNTDPVYRAMHAVSDETLAALFPDMDPAEARTTFGRLHLLGIVRPGPDGNFEIDYDLLEDLFPDGGAPIGGGGGTPIPQSEQDAYDAFLDTLPTGTESQWTYQRWVAESRPATFDAFQRPVSTLPHGTNLADLFTTTNGRLPPNSTDEVLQDVASAQLSGDEDAITNFGTSNPVLQYAMYRAIETTYRDRNGRLRVTRDGGTPEMWTDALHKVISFTPEQILQQQLEMNDVDFRQYMIDNPTATEGMTAQSWYVQSVDPASDGSGGVIVVIKDVNTGVLRTVVVGANTNQ